MITKGMLNTIKRLDVSKDSDLTRERVANVWQAISREQQIEVAQFDVSKATISRSKSFGNISVRLAAVLALVSGADPYYLTAESDENDGAADENRVRQFIIDHGYEKALSTSDNIEKGKPARKPRLKKAEAEPEPEPIFFEEVILDEPEVEELFKQEVMSIQEFADIQVGNLTEAEKKVIYDMPEEDFSHLMKTLELQAKYTDKAKSLMGLIRLILIR